MNYTSMVEAFRFLIVFLITVVLVTWSQKIQEIMINNSRFNNFYVSIVIGVRNAMVVVMFLAGWAFLIKVFKFFWYL